MDKISKLSQAIRLGATFHPQCRKALFERNDRGEITASCAMGAAVEAIGLENEPEILLVQKLSERFGFRTNRLLLFRLIAEMNDHDIRTREEIADWISEQGL